VLPAGISVTRYRSCAMVSAARGSSFRFKAGALVQEEVGVSPRSNATSLQFGHHQLRSASEGVPPHRPGRSDEARVWSRAWSQAVAPSRRPAILSIAEVFGSVGFAPGTFEGWCVRELGAG
jgi:hypothetical protein